MLLWKEICMQKGLKSIYMTISENLQTDIRAIRERVPESRQIGIGEDFCLMQIKYDYNSVNKPEDFGYPRRLDGNVMLFCVKGSVHLTVNLSEYEIKSGDLIICTAGDIVHVDHSTSSGDDEIHLVMLVMSHGFASDLRLDFKRILNEGIIPLETPVIRLDDAVRDILGDHLKLIAKVTSERGHLHKDSVRSLISSMVSVLAGQWFDEVGSIRARNMTDTDTRTNHKRFVFEQFMKLVSENYSEQRRMAFYADKLCLSPKYLSKLIKEVSGKCAPEWIDAYVMLEAKQLLRYSDMAIKEIVYRLHFPNQTVFYKYFKAHSGMTPTEYRNSQ